MSNKNQSAGIGAFIVGALLIALATIVFVTGSGWGKDRSKVVMVFDGSVKGLSVGAPMALRGVQIGIVTDIDLILDTRTVDVIMVVEAEIHGEAIQQRGETADDLTEELIARGLRAQLNTQSLLTGLLYVQLDFHPNSELILADVESPYTQIPTIPTELQRLRGEIESINFSQLANNLQTMAEGLDAFINNEAFQQLPQDMKITLGAIEDLSLRLSNQIETSGPRIDRLLDASTTTMTTVNTQIPKISDSLSSALTRLDQALITFDNTMGEINHLVADDSSTRYALDNALRELALAGRAIQLLAKTLEEQPQAIIRGRSEDTP